MTLENHEYQVGTSMWGRRNRGGAGGQILAERLNPILTSGIFFGHHITTPPSGFSDLPKALAGHTIQNEGLNQFIFSQTFDNFLGG